MILDRAVARLKYGPLVEDGHFSDYRDKYVDHIQGMDEVDVDIVEKYDPVPYGGSSLLSGSLTSSEAAQDLSGQEAWDFANATLEDKTPDDVGLDEIPFYFEHRSRGDDHVIRMGAGSISSFSKRDYRVTFDGSLPAQNEF
jgi:hypothetical protein